MSVWALVGGSEGEEVLSAFHGILEAAEQLLQIFVAFDEIDFGSVDDQKIGAFVAEEKVLVGTGDFFDVLG